MKLLYNAGINIYGLAARLASLRSKKAALFVDGQRRSLVELQRLTAERAPEGYDYWFHAASLGEFEQARPLLEAIRKEKPKAKILLSFFSPSGYEIRKDYSMATAVVYLPADSLSNAQKFLNIARPRKAIFVKYEFWINFLSELKARNIPTYLISAIFRRGQIFFRPWGGMFRRALTCYTQIFVQNDRSKELLASIGINNVTVAGDTRFDRVIEIKKTGKEFPNIEKWIHNHFTLVAGSSWAADEIRYIPWLNDHPKDKGIIAPHEYDLKRLDEVRSMLTHPSMLWSDIGPDGDIPDNVQTVIIDTFGILSSLYRYGDIVLIGGGFGAGIHNINEAAVWGVPILIGPRHKKFKEAADLLELEGAFEYHTAEEAAYQMIMLRDNQEKWQRAADATARYIEENIGATEKILQTIL